MILLRSRTWQIGKAGCKVGTAEFRIRTFGYVALAQLDVALAQPDVALAQPDVAFIIGNSIGLSGCSIYH